VTGWPVAGCRGGLIGVGVSACLMAAFKSFVQWFPAGRLPHINALQMAVGGIGALAAIKNAGATTKMIGFDANPEAHEAILDAENGKIWIADVAQDPYQIGYQISQQMYKYLTTGAVDSAKILISPYLVDASNAKKP
jgi:ABC-type sugar transport system substrate-binding protein